MKEIKLTKGFVTQVDDEDYDYLNQWKWYATKSVNNYYVKCGKQGYMHRLLLNAPNKMHVDHIDHNTLNNQRFNIRLTTPSQNQMNRIPSGISKWKGVSFTRYNKIYAHIKVNGKKIHLGTFKTISDAAKARDIASLKYFGEFAYLNFK